MARGPGWDGALLFLNLNSPLQWQQHTTLVACRCVLTLWVVKHEQATSVVVTEYDASRGLAGRQTEGTGRMNKQQQQAKATSNTSQAYLGSRMLLLLLVAAAT